MIVTSLIVLRRYLWKVTKKLDLPNLVRSERIDFLSVFAGENRGDKLFDGANVSDSGNASIKTILHLREKFAQHQATVIRSFTRPAWNSRWDVLIVIAAVNTRSLSTPWSITSCKKDIPPQTREPALVLFITYECRSAFPCFFLRIT